MNVTQFFKVKLDNENLKRQKPRKIIKRLPKGTPYFPTLMTPSTDPVQALKSQRLLNQDILVNSLISKMGIKDDALTRARLLGTAPKDLFFLAAALDEKAEKTETGEPLASKVASGAIIDEPSDDASDSSKLTADTLFTVGSTGTSRIYGLPPPPATSGTVLLPKVPEVPEVPEEPEDLDSGFTRMERDGKISNIPISEFLFKMTKELHTGVFDTGRSNIFNLIVTSETANKYAKNGDAIIDAELFLVFYLEELEENPGIFLKKYTLGEIDPITKVRKTLPQIIERNYTLNNVIDRLKFFIEQTAFKFTDGGLGTQGQKVKFAYERYITLETDLKKKQEFFNHLSTRFDWYDDEFNFKPSKFGNTGSIGFQIGNDIIKPVLDEGIPKDLPTDTLLKDDEDKMLTDEELRGKIDDFLEAPTTGVEEKLDNELEGAFLEDDGNNNNNNTSGVSGIDMGFDEEEYKKRLEEQELQKIKKQNESMINAYFPRMFIYKGKFDPYSINEFLRTISTMSYELTAAGKDSQKFNTIKEIQKIAAEKNPDDPEFQIGVLLQKTDEELSTILEDLKQEDLKQFKLPKKQKGQGYQHGFYLGT